MNLAPLEKRVAELTDAELWASAGSYLDEVAASLLAAKYEDLWYRVVVLTACKERIPGADHERIEKALGRVHHARQLREPHRVLGGSVPPLVDDVTVVSVAKADPAESLTRTRKIELLRHYVREGKKLVSGRPQPIGHFVRPGDSRTPFERWTDDVVRMLELVGAPNSWMPLARPRDASAPCISGAIEQLGVMLSRVDADVSLSLDDVHRDALAVLGKLLVWGDHLVSLSNGHHNATTWEHQDYLGLLRELPGVLAAAAQSLTIGASVEPDTLKGALSLASAKLDADSFASRLNPSAWHAGWAMWALSWWLSDALNERFTIGEVPCVTFSEVRSTRDEFLRYDQVTCPRCMAEAHVERDELRSVELRSVMWVCRSCDVAGYFPEKAPPLSPWAQPIASDVEETPDEGDASGPGDAPHALVADLSWMEDTALQRIAMGDLAELNACLNIGAYKAALLLAGSVCEAMLLDTLSRNVAVAKTYFQKKPDDFPERASLERLVDIAIAEQLLSTTSVDFAPEIRKYRDLIHPHRLRQGDIKINGQTAALLAHAAVALASDLAEAVSCGRVAAFESK